MAARTLRRGRTGLVALVVPENAEPLVKLESANTGKPLQVAQDDVDGAIDTFRFMAGALRATTSMAAGDYVENHLSVIRLNQSV
jgi:aminobutyraldehyde dehydrogenase